MLTDAYVIGEGLGSDQTSTVTFGLGADTKVASVNIALSDGSSQNINNPQVNKVNTL